ncbi:hypothetical protein RFI_00478 [Reticulomyxa filosa]|uniref:Kelch motif family protein n=1 Tax=Reticulomyxa filosa TaxID=46433 RepID=X6PEW2_RETFI|nr:hypothetical protein RFI_00478 [Reticulomyxa filosa]|eukprot:ETO36584.1 hypothetical protein RFI_00478 [Reticulomyxa filosa]
MKNLKIAHFLLLNSKKDEIMKVPKTWMLQKRQVTSSFLKKLNLKNFSNINNMGNQTTTQKSLEREIKESQHLITPFQTLKKLPIPLDQTQCVLHKHELLICGGHNQRACYSYHILKNEYKFICKYPSHVILRGYCVVKLVDSNKDNNQITLLSFGSTWGGYNKHTLVMKYVSVWSNHNNNDDQNQNGMNKSKKFNQLNQLNKSNNYNQWIPFTDNHNNPIIIGREGMRALIGGINNHLLFITYLDNISVFDLNTFQLIQHDQLPINNKIYYHCFVSKSENRQEQEMMKTNQRYKQNYQMLLFCWNIGLSIEYDEYNNTFQFHKLPVCHDMKPFNRYAYVCINDVILFFGGNGNGVSKSIHKYSIRKNKWTTFKNTLPNPLCDCVAILNEEDNGIHIIGGANDKDIKVSTHMKTKVRIWDPSQLVMVCLFILMNTNKLCYIKLTNK